MLKPIRKWAHTQLIRQVTPKHACVTAPDIVSVKRNSHDPIGGGVDQWLWHLSEASDGLNTSSSSNLQSVLHLSPTPDATPPLTPHPFSPEDGFSNLSIVLMFYPQAVYWKSNTVTCWIWWMKMLQVDTCSPTSVECARDLSSSFCGHMLRCKNGICGAHATTWKACHCKWGKKCIHCLPTELSVSVRLSVCLCQSLSVFLACPSPPTSWLIQRVETYKPWLLFTDDLSKELKLTFLGCFSPVNGPSPG